MLGSFKEFAVIKREQFDQAPVKEKIYRVLDEGKEITGRVFLHNQIKLYAMHGFYAELWYVPAINKISRVESLGIDEVLQIYKKQFDISGLLK